MDTHMDKRQGVQEQSPGVGRGGEGPEKYAILGDFLLILIHQTKSFFYDFALYSWKSFAWFWCIKSRKIIAIQYSSSSYDHDFESYTFYA